MAAFVTAEPLPPDGPERASGSRSPASKNSAVRQRGTLAVDITCERVIRVVVGILAAGGAAGGCSLREVTDEGAGCMSLRVVSTGTMLPPCSLMEGMSG